MLGFGFHCSKTEAELLKVKNTKYFIVRETTLSQDITVICSDKNSKKTSWLWNGHRQFTKDEKFNVHSDQLDTFYKNANIYH